MSLQTGYILIAPPPSHFKDIILWSFHLRTFNHVHVKCFSSGIGFIIHHVGRSARLRCHHVTLNMNKHCCQYKYIYFFFKNNNNNNKTGSYLVNFSLELVHCSLAATCQTLEETNLCPATSNTAANFPVELVQCVLPLLSWRNSFGNCALFFSPPQKRDPPSRQLSVPVACLCLMMIWEQSFLVGLRGNEVWGGRRRGSYWLLQARRSPCPLYEGLGST